jgi:hypothetical protein
MPEDVLHFLKLRRPRTLVGSITGKDSRFFIGDPIGSTNPKGGNVILERNQSSTTSNSLTIILSDLKIRKTGDTAEEISATGIFKHQFIGRIYDNLGSEIYHPHNDRPFLYAVISIYARPAGTDVQVKGAIFPHEEDWLDIRIFTSESESQRLTDLFRSDTRSLMTISFESWNWDGGRYLVVNSKVILTSAYIDFEVSEKSAKFTQKQVKSYFRELKDQPVLARIRKIFYDWRSLFTLSLLILIWFFLMYFSLR